MTKPPAGPTPPETAVPDMDPISSPLHTEITPDESVSPSAEEEELAVLRKSEILARNAVALDAQVEQRPLAKMQEELQEEEDAQEADSQEEAGGNGDKPSDDTDIPRSTTPKSEKHVRKALLKNDDVELNRVQRVGILCGSLCKETNHNTSSYWRKYINDITMPTIICTTIQW